VLETARHGGARTEIFAGADLQMPMYLADLIDRVPAATALIGAVRRCQGGMIASPGYHGSISGVGKERFGLHGGPAR
jgi:FMN reductase